MNEPKEPCLRLHLPEKMLSFPCKYFSPALDLPERSRTLFLGLI